MALLDVLRECGSLIVFTVGLLAKPAAPLLAFCLVVEEKELERTQIPRCNPLSPLW